MFKTLGGLAVTAALAVPVAAAPLTFSEALERASQTAPANEVAEARLKAAQAEARAAGTLPDPRLAVGIDNFPISGPPAFRLGQDDMTMLRVGVEQDVPNAAKRRAARSTAAATTGAAAAARAVAERRVRLGAGLAWIDLAAADRRLAAVDAALKRLHDLAAGALGGVASGSTRPAEALDNRLAVETLRDRRDEILSQAGRARADLARWTGDPAPQIAGTLPGFHVDETLLRGQIENHPELLAAHAEERVADAAVQAARSEKRPDFGVMAAYQRRDPDFGDMVSAQVTVSLPLFTRKRQNPIIAARALQASQAVAQREEKRRDLHAELESGLAEHRMHHDQWQRARDALLPLARERTALERASYGAGRAALLEVIAAETSLVEAELTLVDREAELVRDAVRLTIAYGDNTP